MRTRLTKNAMGLNDCPTTMDAPHKNPDVSKYETGNPESWAEGVNMDHPWDEENAKGREDTGHAKMKTKGANTYASMVLEAKELEAKALRCLKLAETILPDAPADAIERQAVDFMTMSNKSVLSTLRRMREFDEIVSEARVAKIVDAVMEVIAEEKEEKKEEVKEEKKEATAPKAEEKEEEEEEDKKIASIVEAVLQVLAEEEKEEEKKEEEKKAAEKCEEKKEEVKEEVKEEKKEAAKEEKKEEIKEEVKEEKKEAAAPKVEEKKEEVKEEVKEEKKEATKEEKKEEEKVEEKEASLDVSFDEIGDVMASQEDIAVLAQLFKAEKEEEKEEEKKEAKIQSLKNVTASREFSEIEKLSDLWMKE